MKYFLGFILFFTVASINAAILEQQTDGMLNWNYDSETQIRWLDLTHTYGKSFNQISVEYEGWVLATETQWKTMYCKYGDCIGGDDRVFDQTIGYQDYSSDGWETLKARELTAWLTEPPEFENEFGHIFSSNSFYDKRTLGFYLNNVDNISATSDDDLRLGGIEYIFRDDGDYIYTNDYMSNLYDYNSGPYGSALVNQDKNYSVVGWYLIQPVPIPAALWLFGSGILALLAFARLKS